ncbi:MAG: CZB domain-containing protein [Ignavibacteria bacterium]
MRLSGFLHFLVTGEPFSPREINSVNDEINFSEAIDAHVGWKSRLTAALDQRDAPPQLAHEAGDDCACALGRWMSGAGYRRYGHLASFAEVRSHHSRFHSLARDIVELHRGGDAGRAHELVRGEFEEASRNIVAGLRRFSGVFEGSCG